MGNDPICRNCDRVSTEHPKASIINRRQIITLSYPTNPHQPHHNLTSNPHQPHPNESELEAAIREASPLSPPTAYSNFTGRVRIEYKAGWTYEGDLVRGVREGSGRMTWPTGDYFDG